LQAFSKAEENLRVALERREAEVNPIRVRVRVRVRVRESSCGP